MNPPKRPVMQQHHPDRPVPCGCDLCVTIRYALTLESRIAELEEDRDEHSRQRVASYAEIRRLEACLEAREEYIRELERGGS